jgi:hypothetical protein
VVNEFPLEKNPDSAFSHLTRILAMSASFLIELGLVDKVVFAPVPEE